MPTYHDYAFAQKHYRETEMQKNQVKTFVINMDGDCIVILMRFSALT